MIDRTPLHRPSSPSRRLLAVARIGGGLLVLTVLCLAAPAWASPHGSGPLIGFGEEVLNFLTGPLAYVVGGIGICIAAMSLVFGSRDGLVKAMYAIVGAALLIGARQVIEFIASAAS